MLPWRQEKTPVFLRACASEPQARFINSDNAYPAFVAGYASGKTFAAMLRLLKLKYDYPTGDVAYYLPTYDLVRLIAYPRLTAILSDAGVGHTLNKQEHTLTIHGKGMIIFRTLDTPDKIIGYEVMDSLVDELDTLSAEKAEDCWIKIIARNRQPKPDGKINTVGVATTPEGFRFVYDRWEKVKEEGYELIRASTYSNAVHLAKGYILNLKRSYPKQLIAAYLEGKFVNLTAGAVYPDFDRVLNGTTAVIQPGEDLHIGVDFNVYNCSAAVGVIRGGKAAILDELVEMRDTPAVIATIKQKYGAAHPNIFVYPDASGANSHTTNAAESDIALLRQAGFKVRAPDANPRVKDRVAAVNGVTCNGLNERRFFVNARRCPTLVECLEQQVYDKNGEPDKSAGKDHMPDALGYFLHNRYPIAKIAPAKTSTLRV